MKLKRTLSKLTAFLLLVGVPFSVGAQGDSTCTVPSEALSSPLYNPGPCHVFVGSTIFEANGTAHVVPRSDGEISPMAAYINGIYRGDSVIWFSGNWAAGHAESKLTSSSSSIYICSRVSDFRADTGAVSSNTIWTCAYRTSSNDPVTSADVSQYSGCAIVVFGSGPKVASEASNHTFGGVNGNSNHAVNYRCTL